MRYKNHIRADRATFLLMSRSLFELLTCKIFYNNCDVSIWFFVIYFDILLGTAFQRERTIELGNLLVINSNCRSNFNMHPFSLPATSAFFPADPHPNRSIRLHLTQRTKPPPGTQSLRRTPDRLMRKSS